MKNHPSPIDDAKKLEKEAITKLNSFQLFFRKERNLTAANMFKRAASLYKINNKYKDFIRCMITASTIFENNDELHEASVCYLDIARAYRLIYDENGIEFYLKHLNSLHNHKNNYGEIFKEIGEFYKELGKYDHSITYFANAINEFELQNRSYSINVCLDNMCRIYLNSNKFKEAGDTLLKMSSKIKIANDNLIFTAILSFIIYDPIYAKKVLDEKYTILRDNDVKFLNTCINCIINKDNQQFHNAINEFRFKFKVKDEHMNIIKHLKKCLDDQIANHTNNTNDDIDLT